MSAVIQAVPPPTELRPAPLRPRKYSRLGDYAILLKMRVTSLVVMTAWTGYCLGAQRAQTPAFSWKFLCAMLGIGLVSGGAAAMNQVIEREIDGRMQRTRRRPIPGQRIGVVEATAVGMVCILAGAAYLAITTNVLTGILSVLTAAAYVGVYTPLKMRSPICTTIGALPGAMPPLLGWTAARGRVEWEALVLFAILFLWQFPHFLAIAWMYREDYARAGLQMLPPSDLEGRFTSCEILVFTVALLPVSVLPVFMGHAGLIYFCGAMALGLFFLHSGARLAISRSKLLARRLLLASIIYLPVVFGLMMVDRII